MKRSFLAHPRAGMTLSELLVSLVIVTLLASIAVPVYVKRAESARISTAQAECRQFAEAEDVCAAHHGFYVPLQVLNDIPDASNLSQKANPITDEGDRSAVDPNLPPSLLNQNQQKISESSSPRMRTMIRNWQGPFINPQRFYIGDASTVDPSKIDVTTIKNDFPLDPWGNPYRFYSPVGRIGSGTVSSTTNPSQLPTTIGDGQIVTGDDPFDRYAIVSYGPDGESQQDNQNNTDDIIYFFGPVYSDRNESDFGTDTTTTP